MIHSELIQSIAGRYLKVACTSSPLSEEEDVLEIIELCGQHQTHNVLIDQACLDSKFINLKTGLAGLLFHKFSTYHLRVAFLGEWDQVQNERFQELLYECNRGKQFRFLSNLQTAESWLLT